jgi:hypothetical protein
MRQEEEEEEEEGEDVEHEAADTHVLDPLRPLL